MSELPRLDEQELSIETQRQQAFAKIVERTRLHMEKQVSSRDLSGEALYHANLLLSAAESFGSGDRNEDTIAAAFSLSFATLAAREADVTDLGDMLSHNPEAEKLLKSRYEEAQLALAFVKQEASKVTHGHIDTEVDQSLAQKVVA